MVEPKAMHTPAVREQRTQKNFVYRRKWFHVCSVNGWSRWARSESSTRPPFHISHGLVGCVPMMAIPTYIYVQIKKNGKSIRPTLSDYPVVSMCIRVCKIIWEVCKNIFSKSSTLEVNCFTKDCEVSTQTNRRRSNRILHQLADMAEISQPWLKTTFRTTIRQLPAQIFSAELDLTGISGEYL